MATPSEFCQRGPQQSRCGAPFLSILRYMAVQDTRLKEAPDAGPAGGWGGRWEGGGYFCFRLFRATCVLLQTQNPARATSASPEG